MKAGMDQKNKSGGYYNSRFDEIWYGMFWKTYMSVILGVQKC